MADNTTRLWTVPPHPETGEVDLELFGEALEEVAALIRRAGGAARQIARRRELKDFPGVYITESVEIMWTLHAPLPRKPRAARPPEVAEEPEVEPPPVDELDDEELEVAAAGNGAPE